MKDAAKCTGTVSIGKAGFTFCLFSFSPGLIMQRLKTEQLLRAHLTAIIIYNDAGHWNSLVSGEIFTQHNCKAMKREAKQKVDEKKVLVAKPEPRVRRVHAKLIKRLPDPELTIIDRPGDPVINPNVF